ncbi:hypothetical protein DVA86_29070 [Streptomyces armeniacus]|uniref:Uncharacterized protein n=1 Tax=Streptomyces armeniacus TaxID=83291 RepID=A0A345XWN9_9ACTN|nr:hypothetical protein [Streptomyces armeniacus]AXK36055.1 hypothetical protein DVA86_29070 [Streptomyces armeniacus]
MAGVPDGRRLAAVVAGVVAGAVGLGLLATAVLADLDTADQLASLAGAAAGLIGVVISVAALTRSPPEGGRRVRARGGGKAAGGSMRGNALGRGSAVSGPPSAVPRRRQEPTGPVDVEARDDGVAVGEDLIDNAFGDDSERRR